MFQALTRTITELLDSKKAAYSFIASIFASVLHLYFGVSVQDSLLLVSPLVAATAAQAHVDAAQAKRGKTVNADVSVDTTVTDAAAPATPAAPANGS